MRIALDGGANIAKKRSELLPNELALARNCHYPPETGVLTKLPGRSLFGSMGAQATGLAFVKFRSGVGYLLGSAGTAYYTAPAGLTGSFTARATGLTSVGRMEAAYYLQTNRAYLVDGVNRMQVWDGSAATMRAGGLTRPATGAASFLSNGATIYQNGTTFYYCHTEYDDANIVESAPSPAVAVPATAANGTFKYVFPATLTNAGVPKLRLYRTQHGGDIFYLVAEVAATTLRYYDGDDTEGLGLSVDNEISFGAGFKTLDDIFLSTKQIMPMIGRPLDSTYMTVNGTIPIGDIFGFFRYSSYIAGVPSFPHHLYFSLTDAPECYPPVNFIPIGVDAGDPISGAGSANDRLVIFTHTTINRLDAFPTPLSGGGGFAPATLADVAKDHGGVAKRAIVNFGINQPNNRLFYVSNRGPAMTDAYETRSLAGSMKWSDQFFNLGAMNLAIARNFPKYRQIWLFVPSKNSSVPDIAMIYHYDQRHLGQDGVGIWTFPNSARCAAAATAIDAVGSQVFIADTDSTGNVYVQDQGVSDAQNCDASDGSILWEWMTGDNAMGAEARQRRAKRVFLNVGGTAAFDASLTLAVDKRSTEEKVDLVLDTDATDQSTTFGSSSVTQQETRSYRGGAFKVGNHHRWHLSELAKVSREIVTMEVEVSEAGATR